MKYSVRYKNYLKVDNADEFIIYYNKKDTSLLDFLEAHKNKRIVLEVGADEDLFLLKDLCFKYNNLVIKFLQYKQENLEEIATAQIPFFFDLKVDSWDMFIGLVKLKVKDIYIVNELGFELDKIAEIAHKENINIRIIPNIAQSSWNEIDDYKKFFVRPEEVDFYEKYVDICELYGDNPEILLKIYKEDKKWFGKLNEIIIGIKEDFLDGRYMVPAYIERRISCGKKCQKGNPCRFCEQLLELSQTLEKNQMAILPNAIDFNENL